MSSLMTSLVLSGSGCSLLEVKAPPEEKVVEKIVYLKPQLTLPDRPELPTIKSSEMKCLPDDVKKKLVERETLRREYAEDLEAILKSIGDIK